MRYITAAIAMGSGFIVLLGYLFPSDLLLQARVTLTDWAVILAGMAALVGIANLIFVQLDKLRRREKNSMYGVLLIFSLLVTFGLGIVFGPDHPLMHLAVEAVIVPVEASLMAILAVTLVYASIRLLRRRADMMNVLFLVSAVLFLVAVMPTPIGPVPGNGILTAALGLFSTGGARGLLLGIALGTLLTGLRVLFGIDRPYGGN
jgi:hypothetical protein